MVPEQGGTDSHVHVSEFNTSLCEHTAVHVGGFGMHEQESVSSEDPCEHVNEQDGGLVTQLQLPASQS